VYFGDGAYGAEAAAETYFGKSAKDLDISEAATLAGFLHAPSTYVIWEGDVLVPQARERHDRVLRLMQQQGMITREERETAEAAPLNLAPDLPPQDPRIRLSSKRSDATWRRNSGRRACSVGDSGSTRRWTPTSSTRP